MLSAVDGALRRIDADRGDLGATMNRREHTIDNLTNIVMNTKQAKGGFHNTISAMKCEKASVGLSSNVKNVHM